MKTPFFLSCILFLVLVILQFILSVVFFQFIESKKYTIYIVQLSIDISFLIVIYSAIRFLKLNIFDDATLPKTKVILLLSIVSILFVIIYPSFNLVLFFENINNNILTISTPIKKYSIESNPLLFYPKLRVILIMPILEEFFYRRILQRMLLEKSNVFIAIIISSLFFSIGHLDFNQFFVGLFAGFLFGYIYHITKNILYPIILHVFINLMILLSTDQIISLQGVNYLYIIIYLASVIIILTILSKFNKNKAKYEL